MTANTTTDLTTLTPPQIDELWAEAMVPAHTVWAKLAEARRSARRYRKANYAVPAYLTERIETLDAEYTELAKASAPFDAEYERRGGWTRYLILVSSSNGHVHRSPGHCGSLTPGKSVVSPVYELSGNDEAGVVERCGHTACSKCFKTAPVAKGTSIKPGQCPDTGNVYDGRDYGNPASYASNRVSRYAKCPTCGTGVSVTSTGKLRAHKPESR